MAIHEPKPGDVTRLLAAWQNGDRSALDQLIPLVYSELRAIAGRCLRRDRLSPTLQSTALVHEAYMRMVDQAGADWRNRSHFFAVAATIIRNILVERARSHRSAKRGGDTPKLSLDESLAVPKSRPLDLVALDDALLDLSRLDPQQCRIVELRFFTGLSIEETAEALGISASTVKREWILAKTWIFRSLSTGRRASVRYGKPPKCEPGGGNLGQPGT